MINLGDNFINLSLHGEYMRRKALGSMAIISGFISLLLILLAHFTAWYVSVGLVIIIEVVSILYFLKYRNILLEYKLDC
jgi:hypothetical protein